MWKWGGSAGGIPGGTSEEAKALMNWSKSFPFTFKRFRSVPSLIQDNKDPDDIDTPGDDHPADGTRYWAMSRPSPTRHAAEQRRPSPFSAGTLLRDAMVAATATPTLGHANVRGR